MDCKGLTAEKIFVDWVNLMGAVLDESGVLQTYTRRGIKITVPREYAVKADGSPLSIGDWIFLDLTDRTDGAVPGLVVGVSKRISDDPVRELSIVLYSGYIPVDNVYQDTYSTGDELQDTYSTGDILEDSYNA